MPMIAIVDDDTSVRESMKGLVRSLGYKAATFRSAEEFLASTCLHDTWCLIADVQMPGVDGLELQNHLIAEGLHMPFILMTASPAEGLRARALGAGALGFLVKPF